MYSVTHVRISEIKQLSLLFFAILWYIDLLFCMWMYNDNLQIKFTYRSGPMSFGWVMALGLSNLVKYLVVTTLFHYDLRYWLYCWHMSVLWWATDQVYISFRSNDFWPRYSAWTLKFGQIFSCHHFFWLYLEKLSRFLGDFNVNRNMKNSSAFQDKWPTTTCDQPHHDLRINIGPCFHWRTFPINNLQWLLLFRPHDTFNLAKNSMTIKR